MATKWNAVFPAILSSWKGSGPPAEAETGMLYVDDDIAGKLRVMLKMDGTEIIIAEAEESSNTVIYPGGTDPNTGWRLKSPGV